MYYDVEKILSRATLEQLARYLLSEEKARQPLSSTSVRMEKAKQTYHDLMKRHIPDFHIRDAILEEISQSEYNLETMSVMIGLQCGFSLALELLGRTKQ